MVTMPQSQGFTSQSSLSLGFYKGNEKIFSLCLEGLPLINISYHFSSGLPIAKAIPGEC